MTGSNMRSTTKQQLHQQLLDYCRRGCLDNIGSLLSCLPPEVATDIVNMYDQHFAHMGRRKHTPLTIAAMSGHSQVVQLLVQDYKADVNKARSDGMTPLMLAASRGHLKVVNILIQAGCNVNAREKSGESAVFFACRKRQHEVVKHLAHNSADISLPNYMGATCLMIALILGNERLAQVLLEGGADPNTESKYIEYELMERGYITTSFNLRLGDPLYGSPSGFDLEKRTTALHWAVENHRSSIVSLLLSYGAKMFRDEHGYSPLDLALLRRYVDIVEILAESCALSREEKIYSLEGLGFLHGSLSEALGCLRRAIEERKKDLLDFNPQSYSSLSNNYLHLHNAPFESAVMDFLKRFRGMLEEGRTLPFSHVTEVLDYCFLIAEHKKMYGIGQERSDRFAVVSLGAFLFGLKVAKDQEERGELQLLACRLVQLSPLCSDDGSLLHVLANMLWIRPFFLPDDLPFDHLLALLLNSGASVHAKDIDGNRPLHMIAFCPSELEGSEMLASMTRTLVEAGALVGVQNNFGYTPLKYAETNTVSEILRPHFPPSLQSLAATEVMKNKIPFEDEIPKNLVSFVELH